MVMASGSPQTEATLLLQSGADLIEMFEAEAGLSGILNEIVGTYYHRYPMLLLT